MSQLRPAHTWTDYLPEFGRVVTVAEYDRPLASDEEVTAQTIRFMDEAAADESNSPAIAHATAEALEDAALTTYSDPLQQAQAVYWWLKRNVRYVPVPGTNPLVDQTLISPCTVLAMPEPMGDCPQFSMLAAAMFRVLAIPSQFVTIAAERDDPDQYSHVYNTVEVYPGVFLAFDSSNGPEPGAEYSKPLKKRIWPRLQAGIGRTKETAHDMVRTARSNAPRGGMRNANLRKGLRDISCDADMNCYDTDAGTLVFSPTDPSFYPDGIAPDTIAPGTYANGYNDPYAPGGNLNSGLPTGAGSGFLNNLLNAGVSIGSQFMRSNLQPTSGTNGQKFTYNPSTGKYTQVPASTAISPTLILFGVLGIGAIALLSGKK